jgi:hypothetical protein
MAQMAQLALQAQLVLLAHRVFKARLVQLALQAQLVLQVLQVQLVQLVQLVPLAALQQLLVTALMGVVQSLLLALLVLVLPFHLIAPSMNGHFRLTKQAAL